ncbi:low molecular weight phosphotyrosine protein phosphatase-like protein [Tothia fuscella]|uniref:Low molecular weight phosphotyrosine protein phosphatase-like protein n=1 Tax=Tothia fuscella TaxID=1048955 RepID=A0A9P4NZL7_9PEZI|nr:low molecular weight phosphotyrosine protein phosphatase-like protein [Tothia fuscella]
MASSESEIKEVKPISILFVCLGNICRSPMAEGVFRDVVGHPKNSAFAEIDSAGTGAYHTGSAPDPRTTKTLKANGVLGYKHQARKVQPQDFETFDWIFAMDEDNLHNLKNLRDRAHKTKGKGEGRTEANMCLFGDFGGKKGEEVIDPYYGADDGFDVAYEQMQRFTRGFLGHLKIEPAKKE